MEVTLEYPGRPSEALRRNSVRRKQQEKDETTEVEVL